MLSTLQWDGKLSIPNALRLAHDGVSAELVRATMASGPIGKEAKLLAQLCLPHFEWEERTIFPVLGLLPDLARGNLHPEMVKVLPLIAEFSARKDELDTQHRLILSAIEAFLRTALREKDREFTEFAYNLRVHELIEDELIFPMVIVIGEYVRDQLVY
jgi:hypothetical protein